MHGLATQAAEGLTVLDVAPSQREEIERHIAEVARGRFRRPVVVLGIDGAYVPLRPDSARGRRPGQAHQRARRARWKGQWREARAFAFTSSMATVSSTCLSWHQVQTEGDVGEALQQVKEAGLVPAEQVRCVGVG